LNRPQVFRCDRTGLERDRRERRRDRWAKCAPYTGLRAARALFVVGTCLLVVACAAMAPTVTPETPAPAEIRPAEPVPAPSEAAPTPEPATPPLPPAAIEAPTRELHIAAVGDIMLGGSAAPEVAKRGYDYPFRHVRSSLRSADIAFGNLEGPLTDIGTPDRHKRYVFRSPSAQVAPALAAAGFNIVSLANNHTMDYGVEGLKQTLAALNRAGIEHVGAGMNLQEARRPAFLTAGGHTVAFLAYSLTFPERFWASSDRPGTAFGHKQQVDADIRAARSEADIIVVSFHWGREATTELRDYQSELGHAAIEAGASVVLGHHPHILQGIERYRDGIIFYSLGNFVFGSYSRIAQRTVIALLRFQNARLIEVRLIPLNVNNIEVVFQPRPLSSAEATQLIEELQQLSSPLHTRIAEDHGVGLVSPVENSVQAPLSKKGSDARREQ
ncbi:MAG: CapA family protein, partial [Acidiferrobacterales bacterium]